MAEDTGLTSSDVVAGDDILASQYNLLRDDILLMRQDAQTAGETINGATLPVACFLDNSDDEWYACDANVQTKLEFKGFAITNGTDGNAITIQFHGVVGGFTGLTKGAVYYVQDDQTIGTSIGTYEVRVGIAMSATEILIDKGHSEYMGSDTFSTSEGSPTDNMTIPAGAKMAIVKLSQNNGISTEYDYFFTIFKTGFNDTGTVFVYESSPSSGYTHRVQWNATLDFTQGETTATHTMTGTAYFYR